MIDYLVIHKLNFLMNLLMILGQMILSKVVGVIIRTLVPINVELLLGLSISKPMIAHIS